jgi:glycosyltransferase involved in cell wall biosynthesis
MSKLSVVIPFCNEYPQVIFTIQNIAQELRDRVDFEIIAVNNFCKEVSQQIVGMGQLARTTGYNFSACPSCRHPLQIARGPDVAPEVVIASQKGNSWLKYAHYDKKLSHWQAKNEGVRNSTGEFLWFCDAHCIISRDTLYKMFLYYTEHHERLNGSLHLPLTYKILEWHKTMYKLVVDIPNGAVHYSLTPYRHADEPFEVPAVSTCGMMITRKLYDQLGGWPLELGIYGGGENFTNFSKAVMGKKKWMFPGEPLCHHGEKRGYNWNYTDHLRNKAIATYIFGGKVFVKRFFDNSKGRPDTKAAMYQEIITKCASHRQRIKDQQVMSIEEWVKLWV